MAYRPHQHEPQKHRGPATWGAGRAGAYCSTSEEDTTTLPHHDDDEPRCRVCGHTLTARESIARELGPVCRARLAASIAQATGYRAAVEVIGGALVAQLDVEGEGHGRALGR